MGLIDDARQGLSRAAQQAADVIRGDEDIPYEDMRKALSNVGLAEPTREVPRALFHDPYSVQDWGGWREKPSVLTYETLRQMSSKNTIVGAIIQTRVDQVAAFCRPQQGRYDKGYRVQLRDRRDQRRTMTPAEQKMAAEIERMLETTGFLLPEEKAADRDSFRTFMKKSVRDILTYDQWCWEKIRDRRDRISRVQCLPANTIRPAVSDSEHMQPEDRSERVSHVQVYEDTVIAEFSPDDIAWCIKNPRSDIRVNNFGFPPVEQLTNVITSWLYGFEYNTRFFTQGSAIKGVINVKGAIPDRQLKSFRRMWYSMVTGVQNSWRTPILNAEDLQWVSMHSNNREMEYGSWMDWLTKITCAVFGIDPVEINFIFGQSGVTSTLNQSAPNESQVTESKDKGLRPLMDHVSDSLNTHLIWEINPDFEFAFTGLDAKAEDNERAAWVQEVKHFRTVDEIRQMNDLDPLPDKKGEVILDTVWLQNASGDDGGGDAFGEVGGDDDDEDEGGGMFGIDDDDDDDETEEQDNATSDQQLVSAEKVGDGAAMARKSFAATSEALEVLRKSIVSQRVKNNVRTTSVVLGD